MLIQFINAITEKIKSSMVANIIVFIEYPLISLQNCHDLEVVNIKQNETQFILDVKHIRFTIGKNYSEISYDEVMNEYTFKYENDMVVAIVIL